MALTRWFRFHADAMRNPKVAKLSDREFRLWVRLLAVAAENDGAIPPLDDLKHVLNSRLDHLLAGVEALISVGLIDRKDMGYEPHNWNKFQYKSDTSTGRVQKLRASRNVSETPPDTEQIQKQKEEPPKPPRGRSRQSRGAIVFLSKAKELGDGNERPEAGTGNDWSDAGWVPDLAISHQ